MPEKSSQAINQELGSSMQKNLGVKDYQSMQILSAKPEKLILMLYDGAIRFIQQGIKAMEENKIELAHNNLLRSQNIMVELMASLNFEKGGELAVNLFRIYEFMHYTLVQANVKKEAEQLTRVAEQLKMLRESWSQALKKEENGKANGVSGQDEDPDSKTKDAKNIKLTG
jgi:flagellar protein FliS